MWSLRSMTWTLRSSSRAQRSATVRPKKPDPTMRRSAVIGQLCRYVRGIHRPPRLVAPQCTVGAEASNKITEALERVLHDDQPEHLLGQRQRGAEAKSEAVELAVLAEVLADVRPVA